MEARPPPRIRSYARATQRRSVDALRELAELCAGLPASGAAEWATVASPQPFVAVVLEGVAGRVAEDCLLGHAPELRARLPLLAADSEPARAEFRDALLQLVFDFELFTEPALQRLFALATRRNARWPGELLARLCGQARAFLYEQYEALRREEEE